MMKFSTALLLATAILTSACGKDISVEGRFTQGDNDDSDGTDPGTPPLPPGACGGDNLLKWAWTQPNASVSHAVDLLFVVDTSLSLFNDRMKLAHAVPRFLKELPPEADTRVAVMLAHGSSKWNGKLYSRGRDPRVIDVTALSPKQSMDYLGHSLSCAEPEFDIANGELMMYSLQRSLGASKLAAIKNQGFYRDDAALSVVFVTDENDVCFDPRANGFPNFPDFNDSWFDLEDAAFKRYCAGITPESTLAALQSTFPGRAITLGGIVHTDPKHVKRFGEDAIGHGIIELVNSTTDGMLVDIRSNDFEDGLARLGSVVSTHLQLKTLFPIDGQIPFDPSSISVTVDGVAVPATYDSVTGTVQIQVIDAGGAGSSIEISACPS
jgi:hypothetical protein